MVDNRNVRVIYLVPIMREKIVQILKEEKHISGQKIGERLNISRSAVWKYINELRSLGYAIDSSPRRGYMLIEEADLVIPDEVAIGLNTVVMGKSIVYRQQVTSTQELADKLAREGAAEGTLVLAEQQINGRGRKGRVWDSPSKGGVYMSLILRPNLKPVNIIQIPLVAGVALARTIIDITGLPARIKWPNDIQIDYKKVAGILTETNCELDKVNYIILGVGINVTTQISMLPNEIKAIATSLSEESNTPISRIDIIQGFLGNFEKWYFEFINSGLKSLLEEWRLLNNTLGSEVRVFDDSTEITGMAVDLDNDGFLMVQDANGIVHRIISGDVSLRSKYI
jgi:BirA family transcriptional regulator, biotin operon repressor / biotin---[acetyl-CoA-carboxylase] ligase